MNEPTTPSKQNKTLIIILAAALAVSAAAAILLFVRTNSLQAKIEQLQSQSSQLQSQLDAANSQITQLQSQSSQLQSQLDAANSQITQLQPLAAQARKLPVTVSFRKAATGAGYVLVLRNMARKPLALSVALSNPTFNMTKTYRVDIDGGRPKSFGYLEGWAFTSGDQIVVENAEYDPLTVKIP